MTLEVCCQPCVCCGRLAARGGKCLECRLFPHYDQARSMSLAALQRYVASNGIKIGHGSKSNRKHMEKIVAEFNYDRAPFLDYT